MVLVQFIFVIIISWLRMAEESKFIYYLSIIGIISGFIFIAWSIHNLIFLFNLKNKPAKEIESELINIWSKISKSKKIDSIDYGDTNYIKIRIIGEILNERGGVDLMKEVYSNVEDLANQAKPWWNGIGGWEKERDQN